MGVRIVAFVWGLFMLATAWAQPISNVVVFGDSLSDNGNGYEYTKHQTPAAPWYYLGRYSNGPIWLDHLSEKLFPENTNTYVLNYAFGGAGALSSQGHSFTLSQEIDSYLLSHARPAPSDGLFILWIGANDYLFHPQASDTDILQIVTEIERNLHRLVKHGANNIMLLSLPNLGHLPFARAVDLTQTFSTITEEHNRLLHAMFVKMQQNYPNVCWIYFDIEPIWAQALQQSQAFGAEHVREACLQFTPGIHKESLISREFATQCQGYMFFDQLHPTTWVHAMLADAILRQLRKSPG